MADDEGSREAAEGMCGRSVYDLLSLMLSEIGSVFTGLCRERTSLRRHLILGFISLLSSHVFVGRELELLPPVSHLQNGNNSGAFCLRW